MHRRSKALAFVLVAVSLLTGGCAELEPLSTEEALERLHVATTKVYDSDGNVIANLHGEINRDTVPLERIPKHVRDAVIAIEDERFEVHQGVDLRSIARAVVRNAESTDRSIQGGSTISQQLAKNLYFLRPARTLGRKVTEARITLQIERQYTKDEILEMYLNTIYFGRGLYGIDTAAHSYFAKRSEHLALSEAAFLAGLIHEPGRYEWTTSDNALRRRQRLDRASTRRNTVLDRMLELGSISEEAAEEAKSEALRVQPVGERRWRHPYFVDLVLKQLGVQRNSRSERLDPRFAFLGSSFEERDARVHRGGLRIYTTLDPQAQRAAEEAIENELPADLERLSAALVAVEPRTGYIRALVGGRDYYPDCEDRSKPLPPVCELAKVNLALGDYGGGSGRQPGSSFKPFVLAAALQRGITLSTTFPSDPFSHAYPGGVWPVSNYDGAGGGNLDLMSATARSVNAVFAHLEIDGVGDGDAIAGAQRVASTARRLGIGFRTPAELQAECGDEYLRKDSCLPADATPSIALGAKEVAPLEMASAYATFANDGVRVEPTAIVRVTDGDGRILYEADRRERSVLTPAVARSVNAVLRNVIQSGTATRAAIDRPAAAKTGTSQEWRDAWLAGYVPQLAAVVWVGNPIPRRETGGVESMTPANGYPFRIVGGTIPASIWREFMGPALEGVPVKSFAPAPAVVFGPTEPLPEETPLEEVEEDPEATPGTIPVPDVIGKFHGAARNEIEDAGFEASVRESCDPDGETRLNRVWAQYPEGGDLANPGDTVDLWYESGDCDDD